MSDEREKAWKDWGMLFDQMASEAVAKCGFYAGYNANEPTWTYCEDAMPESYREVFIAYKYDGELYTSCGCFDPEEGEFYWSNGILHPFTYIHYVYNVIAWMPLPAPAEPKEAK